MLLCKENYERALCSLIVDTSGTVIAGYEYTYDDLGRILSEIHLAKNIKYDYTYDSLSRVTKRTLTNLSGNTTSEEVYAYDNAGNITSCTVSNGANTFVYDQNNRLISCNGQAVTYDMDGNMLSATLNGAQMSFVYDSANRLISAGQNSYTYNVEDVRVRNLCGESETTYAYNTNGRLSQLLVKTTDGVITKYVYGLGLIGEEKNGEFKTYHFDFRGSTVAITDSCGNITDTFRYDTYGRLESRTGNSFVIFGYNGRDGVVTDRNGLLYMRARYYSPDMRRFINADIIPGEISNAVTLNRYAYANGNPVSNTDPFGLSAERGDNAASEKYKKLIIKALKNAQKSIKSYYKGTYDFNDCSTKFNLAINELIESLNNESEIEKFSNGVKIRIDINPNYNTSGDELIGEIVGFIPVLGEIMTIVDYASDERKNLSKLYDLFVSVVTEDDITKLTPIAKELKSLNSMLTALGFVSVLETLANWNSSDKVATEIGLFLTVENGDSYMYQALVDKDLMFKELYSGYTGSVISKKDPYYQLNLL